MKQFTITAFDHTHTDTLDKRLAHREQHLTALRLAVKQGTVFSGGALLDDDGKMVGSSLHTQFLTKNDAEAWVKNDIFFQEDVWNPANIRIQETKLLPIQDILAE